MSEVSEADIVSHLTAIVCPAALQRAFPWGAGVLQLHDCENYDIDDITTLGLPLPPLLPRAWQAWLGIGGQDARMAQRQKLKRT